MSADTMQALTYDPGTGRFCQSRIPVPAPGPDDVLVKVDACGLNPVDAKIGLWQDMAPGMGPAWVGGLDVSGHVVACGAQVSQWQIGDRVLCHGDMFRPSGGFAQYSVQRGDVLIPHPDVDAVVAAASPCAAWTAWRALNDKMRARERDSILITGGSGGVGSFAIQIARHLGVETVITSCSAGNHDYVRTLGATHAIDYRTEDVVARVHEITDGQGVAMGLDTVGPDNDIAVADSLAYEGAMVELLDVVRPHLYRDAFMRGLDFHQLSLGAGHREGPRARRDLVRAGQAVSRLLEHGELRVPALKRITIHELGDALGGMLKQRTVGKIVVCP